MTDDRRKGRGGRARRYSRLHASIGSDIEHISASTARLRRPISPSLPHVPSGDSSPRHHLPSFYLFHGPSFSFLHGGRHHPPSVLSPHFFLFSRLSSYLLSDTAIHSDIPITDPSSIASISLNSSTSPSQSRNTPPWPFPSPSSLPSPSSYPLPGHSNHPSPADSAHSPSNMIGAPPAFYDPEREAQPQAPDYHDWAASYAQPQLGLTSSSSYPHRHSTTDPRPESQAQPTPQHRDQYQFVNQPPPSTSPDAAHYPYYFDPSSSLSQAITPQGWSPQEGVFSQPQASNNSYLNLMSQSYSAYDPPQTQQHQTQPPEHVARLAVTPVSDTTLPSASRVSPASVSNALPSPGPGSSNTSIRTVLVHPNPKRGSKSTKPVRKRQKPETDEDDDEDVLSAGIDTNAPRPNPNRL